MRAAVLCYVDERGGPESQRSQPLAAAREKINTPPHWLIYIRG